MAKGTRITLTNAQAESVTGKRLINMILSMCHDGKLEFSEVAVMHVFLVADTSEIPAVQYLRSFTREAVADGSIDDIETYRLKLAFERVVPKEVRGVISTHLEDIPAPSFHAQVEPAWTRHGATSAQIEYILALGGKISPNLTKGDASLLIESLLIHRPPTPRQMMLIRFFNRLDLASRKKDDVSLWIDVLYSSGSQYERAWQRFKRSTNHDPIGTDPTVVPIGAYTHFL